MTKKENIRSSIFVRIEREDMLKNRKELLISKINSLRLLKAFRNYALLRKKELEKKELIRRKLNLMRNKMRILTGFLPKIDSSIEKIGKEVGDIEEETKSDFAIERELREIQVELEKLDKF